MVIVVGEIAVDPDEHDQLIGLIDAVENASRQEEGCLRYDFWVHRSERGQVHVSEKWSDAEALAAHVAGDAYRTFARGLKGLAVRKVDIQQHVVTDA